MKKRNDDIQPNYRLKALIMGVVDNQINENNPPITAITYKRLMAAGDSSKVAKEKIAAIVVENIYGIMTNGNSFDEEKYIRELEGIK